MKPQTVKASFEKYSENSYRIKPSAPFKKEKQSDDSIVNSRAKVVHWHETDAMDIVILPPHKRSIATNKLVKRWPSGVTVTRSLYGKYRIQIPADDEHGKLVSKRQLYKEVAEAIDWIAEDQKKSIVS